MSLKKITLYLVWTIAILAWLALIAFNFTDPVMNHWVMAVTGAAILTEVAFWITAALFGATMWESRRKVFGFLFRRSA